jgi:hypothetical protein
MSSDPFSSIDFKSKSFYSGSPCLYACFNAEISLICTCPRYKSRNVMIDSWTNLNSSQICLPLALGIEIFTKHTVLSSAMTMSIV